jgi:hypothetical protein
MMSSSDRLVQNPALAGFCFFAPARRRAPVMSQDVAQALLQSNGHDSHQEIAVEPAHNDATEKPEKPSEDPPIETSKPVGDAIPAPVEPGLNEPLPEKKQTPPETPKP